MSDEMNVRLRGVLSRLKPRLGGILLLVVGFALGGVVFASRSPSVADPHAGHSKETGGKVQATTWTCAMHPQIRQPEPGQCPICGMDLIPVTSGEAEGAADPRRIVLSERARALSELRTSPVRRRADASARVRLLGRIEPNETTLRTVTAWTGGRIDRLHVNVTGERVRAGQVIATLYSPEVFAAHQDLLVAKRQLERMASSPGSSKDAASAALDAARERLRLLGLPDDELARMETEEQPTRAVTIRTPFAGTVIERMATEGAYVSTGTPLYRVANLSRLWVQLDAYESDLPRISVGQVVQVTVDSLPGEEFDGNVTFIEPTLDKMRRTALVRVEVENRDGRLRPGVFAEATVATGPAKGDQSPLVVPASAPLFTGRRAIIYVEEKTPDRTVYEARTVRLGPRLGNYYPVVAGLAEGERVVTRGAFAVDADLQIRGGASMMTSGDDREPGAFDTIIELSSSDRAELGPTVTAYLEVQAALAADDPNETQEAAKRLATAVAAVKFERSQSATKEWTHIARTLSRHAEHIASAKDLSGARTGFEPLSAAIEVLLRRFGNPLSAPLHLAFCPMAAGSQGASWIQRGAKIDNSYFGAAMRTCGEVKQQVAPGSYLKAEENSKASAPPSAPAGGHQH